MFFKKTFLCVAMFLFAAAVWAGDSASFVDLGFSPDGKVFMFAQYGVQSGTLKPWADLFAVDVVGNNFVSGGKASYIHDTALVAGNDGSGALYRIIALNTALANQYRINYMNLGQPLYIAMNGVSGYGEAIEFRDFSSGNSYKANLVPYTEGSAQNLKSSFFINLECSSASGRRSMTVGNPQIKRPLIEEYRIYKVIASPSGDSLIFIIEMKKQTAAGFDLRYMVEAKKL